MDFPKGFKEKYEQILGAEAADFFATFDEEPISAFRSNPLKKASRISQMPFLRQTGAFMARCLASLLSM